MSGLGFIGFIGFTGFAGSRVLQKVQFSRMCTVIQLLIYVYAGSRFGYERNLGRVKTASCSTEPLRSKAHICTSQVQSPREKFSYLSRGKTFISALARDHGSTSSPGSCPKFDTRAVGNIDPTTGYERPSSTAQSGEWYRANGYQSSRRINERGAQAIRICGRCVSGYWRRRPDRRRQAKRAC